jgi:hypothetical protein
VVSFDEKTVAKISYQRYFKNGLAIKKKMGYSCHSHAAACKLITDKQLIILGI